MALRWLVLGLCIVSRAKVVTARPSTDASVTESSGTTSDDHTETVTKREGSSLNTNVFNISITDTAGRDLSQSIQVFHSSSNGSGTTLEKRGYSRPLENCPEEEIFVESNCRDEVSPQSYVLKCSAGPDTSWYFRRCAPSEVCIQGIPKRRPSLPDGHLVPQTLMAYCVSTDNFRRISEDNLAHKTIPGTIGVKYNVPEGKSMAFEAVLTGQNMHESIFASSLRISAQTSDTSNNVQTWRSQVGGTAVCTDCARILIAPVPEKTQRIVMSIVLKAGAAGGLLFLSSVAI